MPSGSCLPRAPLVPASTRALEHHGSARERAEEERERPHWPTCGAARGLTGGATAPPVRPRAAPQVGRCGLS
eukprot:3483517-Alexandrium_andersonii.AAC.1